MSAVPPVDEIPTVKSLPELFAATISIRALYVYASFFRTAKYSKSFPEIISPGSITEKSKA